MIMILKKNDAGHLAGLRSRGYRITSPRQAVLEVLEENEGRPLSTEEIHRLASTRHEGIGLATVYRTLELFCELQIAARAHLHRDSEHFEINSGSHHHHLVCVSCGEVEMLEECVIEEVEKAVRDRSDFLVTSHCMSLFGYCPSCIPGG